MAALVKGDDMSDPEGTRYINAAGQEVGRAEYYGIILATIAREQQATFPWWHPQRYVWKWEERKCRREAQSPDPSDGTP